MRVIFGDRAKYFDKFKTCARVRPLNEQRLSTDFFIKEHSKPLFNSHGFLNFKNLYFYQCCEVFNVFKYKSPIAINDLFKFSSRGQRSLFMITPPPNDSYVYRMSVIWNSISVAKNRLRTFLLMTQKQGNLIMW